MLEKIIHEWSFKNGDHLWMIYKGAVSSFKA